MKQTNYLGLTVPELTVDGNAYFNVEDVIIDNFEKIDANAATHEAEIASLQDEVGNTLNKASVALSNTTPVVSIDAPVSGPLDLAFTAPDFMVNVNQYGDCEDVSKWVGLIATHALDATNKMFGSNGIVVTSTGTSSAIRTAAAISVDNTKYYFVSAYAKNIDATTINLMATKGSNGASSFGISSSFSLSTTEFKRAGIKLSPANIGTETAMYPYISFASSVAGKKIIIDGVMLKEITADEYNNLTEDQLLAKYPYVNGIQPLMNPCLTARGTNLFGGIEAANKTIASVENSTYAYLSTIDDREVLVLIGNAAINNKTVLDKFKSDIQYTIQCYTRQNEANSGGKFYVEYTDGTTSVIMAPSTTVWTKVVITTTFGKSVKRIYISYGFSTTNYFDYNTLQLEEGSAATAYEPYKESSAILVGEFAKIGAYADTVKYENGEAKKLEKVKKVVLDGGLAWVFHNDQAGHKAIKSDITNALDVNTAQKNGVTCKYDGKILNIGSVGTGADYWQIALNILYITISDTDSGWGETFTPTAAEMQACMNGWKLNNGVFGTPYNGSGTKTWTKWNATDNTGAVTTVPTTKADGWTGWAKLWYALAAPVEENIQVIGNALSVFQGKCTLDVQMGIVYEKANPVYSSSNDTWYINNSDTFPNSLLKYKSKEYFVVYRNRDVDTRWILNSANTNGTFRCAYSDVNNDFDTTAEYFVLYRALPEEYNNQQISLTAYYPQNLRDAHNELAETVGTVAKDLSLLEEQVKAEWKSWVPTLTWTTGTPATNVVTIARYQIKDKKVFFNFYYVADDGNGATALKISLPVIPKDNDSRIPLSALQRVNTTWSNPLAYIDDDDGNGIQFRAFATATDAQAVELHVSGFYEIP